MRNLVCAARLFGWILAFCATAIHATAQEQGKRVALIIGNNNYSLSPLRNAINDARLMEKALGAAGFKTIVREDATFTALEEAAAEFAGQLGPDDTALFFYAGHGIQIEGENFLVPVDFEPASSIIQAKFKCFKLAQLYEELQKRSKRSIFILDACRSNPVAQSHGLASGLAQPQFAGNETFTAFSTNPGQVAADNPNGRDSWFTEALADLIQKPDLTLDSVFTQVTSRVKSDTEGHQTPWKISNLTSTFYFHPPSDLKAVTDPAQAEKWMLEAQRREQRQEWDQALALVQQVVNKKPGGSLEAAAKGKIPYLTARREARLNYDASKFEDAARSAEQSLTLDPFSIDAAFEAVSGYLLSDKLPEAVRILSAVRVRGTSASIEKANLMLKELAVVYPEAAQELKAEIPSPPAVETLFPDTQFGLPDWTAGMRSVNASPMHLARWSKALETAYPPPPEQLNASVSSSTAAKIATDFFHIEISATGGDTRDLAIRRVSNQVHDGPSGSLILMGTPAETSVIADGVQRGEKLPATLTLAPGKYDVRTIEHGRLMWHQEVEILAFQTKTLTIQGK